MAKRQVYLNEYQIEVGNSVFLPYSTGILQAYAQQFDKIKQSYDFKQIIFRKDTVKNIVAQYNNPDIVGFSAVIWNYKLSLAVAKALKEKFHKCYIVFGGPCIQTNNNRMFQDHPYVDMAVYGEGERIFAEILLGKLSVGLPINTTYKTHTGIKIDNNNSTNIDCYPSPYMSGIYDSIVAENPDLEFKALVECNRNCPFGCDYCFWGQPELEKKIKYHSADYIEKDAEWIAKHKIDYVFCTDANFGMFKRDIDTAKTYVKTKQQYGYPQKFRVCYGKNATDTIFQAASTLHAANMDKLITLSVQSTNPDTLRAVNRRNIKSDTFKKLQKKYLTNDIATYTEFILGLPLETKDSFYDGLDETIETIKHNQIFVYPCQVLPNTKLASQEYREKYGLITKIVPMRVPHTNVTSNDWVQEWDEIIVGTNTMPVADWCECTAISWTVQLLHSLKVGYDLINYIHITYNLSYMFIYDLLLRAGLYEINMFYTIADQVAHGSHWSQTDDLFGNVYYEPEELAYLRILHDKDRFYNQLSQRLRGFNDPQIDKIIEQTKQALPNTDNVTDWAKFAMEIVICGGKNNEKEKSVWDV